MFGLSTLNRLSRCYSMNKRQLPDLYSAFEEIFDELGMDESIRPECFLQMNPIPNAYTVGNTKTYIVLHSGIVELLSRDELKSVIAHECGHIICKHVLYHSLARNIANLGLGFLGIGALVEPVKLALLYWDRCSRSEEHTSELQSPS